MENHFQHPKESGAIPGNHLHIDSNRLDAISQSMEYEDDCTVSMVISEMNIAHELDDPSVHL